MQMGPGCMTQYSTFAMLLIELGFPGCMMAIIADLEPFFLL